MLRILTLDTTINKIRKSIRIFAPSRAQKKKLLLIIEYAHDSSNPNKLSGASQHPRALLYFFVSCAIPSFLLLWSSNYFTISICILLPCFV